MMFKRRSSKDDSLIGNIIKHRVRRGPILKALRDQFFLAATEIYDADEFEVHLRGDIDRAEKFVMIISPFLGQKKVNKFVQMKEVGRALERQVKIIVVTKDPEELKTMSGRERSNKAEYHKKCIDTLKKAGVDVKVINRKLHFKAAIIDGKILYVGSINFLSVTTEEVTPEDYMLRFESEGLVAEVVDRVLGWETYSDWIES